MDWCCYYHQMIDTFDDDSRKRFCFTPTVPKKFSTGHPGHYFREKSFCFNLMYLSILVIRVHGIPDHPEPRENFKRTRTFQIKAISSVENVYCETCCELGRYLFATSSLFTEDCNPEGNITGRIMESKLGFFADRDCIPVSRLKFPQVRQHDSPARDFHFFLYLTTLTCSEKYNDPQQDTPQHVKHAVEPSVTVITFSFCFV